MKQELPISVILLALGAWCCFQFPSNAKPQPTGAAMVASEVDSVANQRGDFQQSVGQPHFSDTNIARREIAQASWQTPAVEPAIEPAVSRDPGTDEGAAATQTSTFQQAGSLQPEADVAALRAFAPAEFLRVATANDMQATNALVQIANGIQQLPPFATRTKISSRLFGVSMAATGKYFQSAGGLKSRMEIQYVSPVAKTVLQMSDGRFVYFLKSDRQHQKLEFIDLFRLANDRGMAGGGLLPTTWVMGGGIGKALSHYTGAFDFQKVDSSQQSNTSERVTTYRGIWKADVLLHLIHAGTPDADRPAKVVWADVPRQLPHAIELTFTAEPTKAAVPKQISFFQFSTDKEISTAKEMVRIEFSPFEFKNKLPDELFTLESTDFEATDVTSAYQSQIQKLSQGMDKVADQRLPRAGLR